MQPSLGVDFRKISRPQIEGRENLPAKDKPAVYVANHQSFLVRWPRVACSFSSRAFVTGSRSSV